MLTLLTKTRKTAWFYIEVIRFRLQ